jgi:hypothetical protein
MRNQGPSSALPGTFSHPLRSREKGTLSAALPFSRPAQRSGAGWEKVRKARMRALP